MKTFRILYFAAAVLCCCSASELFGEDYGQITIQPLSLVEKSAESTVHGYVELQFRITNKSKKAYRIELSPSSPYRQYRQNTLEQIKSTAEVPAETSVLVRLQQPPFHLSPNSEFTVSINGVRQEKPLASVPFSPHCYHHLYGSSDGNGNGHILASQGVPADTRDLITSEYKPPEENKEKVDGSKTGTAAVSPVSMYSNERKLFTHLSSVPVSEWSDSFLFYTRFDCVALTDKEYNSLETGRPAVLAAIRKYTELGGLLCIVVDDEKKHNWKAPKEWIAGNDKNSYRAVFGDVYILGKLKGNENRINPFRETVLKKSADLSYHTHISPSTLFAALPVIDHYGIPVKLVLALIFIFALLIGPVNIFVLHYLKKRIYLLWTVPLLSFIACGAVLGISLIQEGLLFQSSSVSFTVLDQRREEALTAGYAGYYSTFTPAGLTFPPDTEVSLCSVTSSYSESPLSLRYELQNGNQLFTNGWIQARIPAYFMFRRAQPQRKERISFDFSGSEATAVNGFGVHIRRVTVCSPEGQLYEAENIKAGEKTVLNKLNVKPLKPALDKTSKKIQEELRQHILTSAVRVSYSPDILSAGSYLAETDTWNPFLEPGLEKLKPYKNSTAVLGFF